MERFITENATGVGVWTQIMKYHNMRKGFRDKIAGCLVLSWGKKLTGAVCF